MFRALGHFNHRYRVPVLIAGAFFLVVSAAASFGLFGRLSSGGYWNPRSESARVQDLLRSRFTGSDASLVVLMTAPAGKTVDDPNFAAEARKLVMEVARQPGVLKVQSVYQSGAPQLVSNDRRATFALCEMANDSQQSERVTQLRQVLARASIQAELGGLPVVDVDVLGQVARDLKFAEVLSLPVVAALLVIVFGSLIAASLPLAMGGISILGAFLLLRLLVMFIPISVFAVNVVSMLGMGLAIDYSLFIVSRFREELALGKTVEAALIRTLQTAGHTVLFSGLTVTLSLLSLLFFPQMLLRSMAWGGAAGVLLAMGSSLTVLPALLAVLGPRVNDLAVRRKGPSTGQLEERGFWYRLSAVVMKHPILVLIMTLSPMLLAGSPFLHVRFSMPDERNIPSGLPSRTAIEHMRAHFAANELTPIQMVVHFPDRALDTERLIALYAFVQIVKQQPGIARVDSLVSLDPRLDRGGPLAYTQFYSMVEGGMIPEGKGAVEHFANGPDALVQAYFSPEPHAEATRQLVRALRALPPPTDATVVVGGDTAQLVDLLDDMARAVPKAMAMIVITIFVLLFAMLGSLVVPLKAVILNFLSLTVSFGSLVWVFQDGHAARFLGVEPLGSLDALQPMLVFVIAFGLSMDYEVFLLSRIKETFDLTQDNTRAVALGVQRTGGIITSAALLLGVVIFGFAAGRVMSMKQVGMGLFLAILVDATLVRSLLVPATMRLLGHLNWWAPAPLRRAYLWLGVGRLESE